MIILLIPYIAVEDFRQYRKTMFTRQGRPEAVGDQSVLETNDFSGVTIVTVFCYCLNILKLTDSV